MKKLLATLSLTAVAAFVLTACGGTQAAPGVYDDKIVVGNTAATTGAFAAVGVPFNGGLNTALNTYNLGALASGNKTVRLVSLSVCLILYLN